MLLISPKLLPQNTFYSLINSKNVFRGKHKPISLQHSFENNTSRLIFSNKSLYLDKDVYGFQINLEKRHCETHLEQIFLFRN